MAAHPPSLCFSATRQRGPTVWNMLPIIIGKWYEFLLPPERIKSKVAAGAVGIIVAVFLF
jgi:hypothetical protein